MFSASISTSSSSAWPPHISQANDAFVSYQNLHYDPNATLLPPVVSIANTDTRLLELNGTQQGSSSSDSLRAGLF